LTAAARRRVVRKHLTNKDVTAPFGPKRRRAGALQGVDPALTGQRTPNKINCKSVTLKSKIVKPA
jgi:hypothetical protein